MKIRYLMIAACLVVLGVGVVLADEAREASGYQAQTQPAQQERYDMQAAEDRWVKVGSWFFMFLIVVLLVKRSADKRNKPTPPNAPMRRPPARR